MARYKDYDYHQTKMIPLSFERQILPGSFEYTLSYLVDHELDLSIFEHRYCNDETGAPAYDPAFLLKIVLYAYSRGITSSRQIERGCRENIIFMALSADTQPHFTTIANFIATLEGEITALFRDVLLYCDQLGLIGKEMFAIDGCKLPSNASKEWSGTRADFERKKQKLEGAVRHMLKTHRERDRRETTPEALDQEQQYIQALKGQIRKIKAWLDNHDDKPGKTGQPKKSNITDNDSAKMKTGHGVIQGYGGVAAVDARHQVIVHAQAFGEAQEHDLLQPMIEGTRENFQAIEQNQDIFDQAKLTADAGFHSEANMQYLHEQQIDGYVADNRFRKRDPRFNEVDKYKQRHRQEQRQYHGSQSRYTPQDFTHDPERQTCICPAGQALYRNGSNVNIDGCLGVKFTAPKRACLPCPLRAQCLRHPERTAVRQVVFFKDRTAQNKETFTAKMKRKIDSTIGKAIYSLRLGIVEPVFGNLTYNKGLRRFTLRGKSKVDTQWKIFCIVHNLGKIHRYGEGFG